MTRTTSRQKVTIDVGDVEIGAVEIKDASTSLRANVVTDGVNNALVVKQNSQPLPANAAQETGGNLENLYNDFFDTLDNGPHTMRTNIVSDDVGLLKTGDATLQNIDNQTFNTAGSVASIDTKTPALVGGRVPVDGSGVTQPVSATSLPLPTGASTEAKQDAEAVLIGAVNETAPGTDTASSGLNGRLQRIAQNITSYVSTFTSYIGSLTETAPTTDTASSGLNGRLQRIAQNLTTYRIDFLDRVAMSLESPTFISLPRSGRNPDVDTAAPEDIWNAGGTWTPITTAQTITVVSSSASDTGAGVGMRAILVTGLDASYAIATETIVLTGTTPVVSVGTWTMIHTLQGVSFGSSATNVGTITATATTDTTTQIIIAIGRGISGISFAMIPAGYTGYLKHIRGDSSSGTAGTITTFNLMLRVFGTNGWIIPASYRARADGDASFDVELAMPYMIPEKSIIKLQAETTNNNTVVNCFYEILLKQN